MEVVESFTYLGSLIHASGSSEPEIKRRINIVREAVFTLDQNIWRSSITLETKLRLYNTCILRIFLYGAETWSATVILSKKIDALDNWCLRWILNVHWTEFVTNDEIRSRTGQPLLSDTVRSRRLPFFGHLHRTDPSQDHYRALQACILGPPDDWRRGIGRPRQSWLRTVEADLRQMNLGLATSKRRAQDRSAWRKRLRLRQAPEEEEIAWPLWSSIFSAPVKKPLSRKCCCLLLPLGLLSILCNWPILSGVAPGRFPENTC